MIVQASDAYRTLRALQQGEQSVRRPASTTLYYLLQLAEVFARSYAQWIVMASGDDDDFIPIAQAFEALFEAQAWRR